MDEAKNIFPTQDRLLKRADKEKLLGQRAKVIWMTGLSGSGKTTIAKALEAKLHDASLMVCVLDGDNIREGINSNLGFSDEDRLENIRRIAEVSKLFLENGIICINCFVSPTIQIRELAKSIIGPDDFLEVYVNAPLEICEKRDVKGLYKKARAGEIADFTGISAPFEAPPDAALEIRTDELDKVASLKKLEDYIMPIIKL